MTEKRKSDNSGTELAKVLWYYNLIPETHTLNQKIVCPFHSDVNPSLLVDLEAGSWFCFGCNESGDAFSFAKLMEAKYNGLNDLQAYIKFRKILKSDKCSNIRVTPGIKKGQKTSKQMYDESYDYYHGLKTYDWQKEDDVEEIIEARQYMEDRGFSPKTLNECRAKVTYSWSYGIIFPMLDNGKFKGWVCRTMRKQVEERRKYLYNAGFSRATTLVGNYGKEKYVIVVEGYMDRLRFVHNGVTENVVAILGWKMSAQQEQKLRDAGVTHIISALDNDSCGRKGTKYLRKLFGSENVTRFRYLKGIKDPGEMDSQQFNKMYNKTMEEYENANRKGE